jgi:ABC-type antimicrobial peptide transport system permease subunit
VDLGKRLSLEAAQVSAEATHPAQVFVSSTGASMSMMLQLPGVVTRQDGAARANGVNVIGVDPAGLPVMGNWHTSARADGQTTNTLNDWRSGQAVFINEALAGQLQARPGDDLVVRVFKPTTLGFDAAITPKDQNSVALRLKVGAVLSSAQLGDFSLRVQALPPANLFLPLNLLGDQVGLSNRANLLVFGPVMRDPARTRSREIQGKVSQEAWRLAVHQRADSETRSKTIATSESPWMRAARALTPPGHEAVPDDEALPRINSVLERSWLPEDAQLTVRAVEQSQQATGGEPVRPFVEVSTSRIFLDDSVKTAALRPRTQALTNRVGFANDTADDVAFARFTTNGMQVLTYLANLLWHGDRKTPYSMITAADHHWIPAGMKDDEILLNEWLAEDLQAKPGDTIHLSYYVVDSGSRLVEKTNSFQVRDIVPLRGIYADRTLMPEFPGLAKAESTHDWEAGFPLVHEIRDKDENYWKKYRGTPKGFITLAAGQSMWGNRFGTLTAIRYEVPANTFPNVTRDAVYRQLIANLDPQAVGLTLEPVREQALRAATQSQDFGELFMGFSFFLILSALLLMALLFQFGLEQRGTEVGTLLAMGFTPGRVRMLLLVEASFIALAGGVLGAVCGLAYARAMLWGLATIWRGAIGTIPLGFVARWESVAMGAVAGWLVAVVTIWFTLRRQARQPARALLAGEASENPGERRSFGLWIALGAAVGAAAILGWIAKTGAVSNPGAFFGAGALLLIGGLAGVSAWLASLRKSGPAAALSLTKLAIKHCARRKKRSLATVALLASGSFVIISIAVFRLDASADATRRSSGTGGFALLGTATLPIPRDLNSPSGREAYGLNESDLAGTALVAFRVRAGDEASCLNLNRAQRPRILGGDPAQLKGRFTFASELQKGAGWAMLGQTAPPSGTNSVEEIPAIGDANSIQWALGKKIGDTLDYTDERGQLFRLKLVGGVANSILQGSLIIDERQFVKRFPTEGGYRMFLIEAPTNAVKALSATLSRALEDSGLEIVSATGRLNEFNAVQNTYLGTFQVLGGLGLLLGSAGLGIVVMRNVFERRGELGLLTAVGFRGRMIQGMILLEHALLLGLGLAVGIGAAAVAVLPALLTPGSQLPWLSLSCTLGAVVLNGLAWTWLATSFALRGNLLSALRNE